MKSIQTIIDIFGGMNALRRNYIRLENEPYMRLVIEHIGTGPRGLPMISVAHYGEQNGDAMRDPDMVFEIDAAGEWHPVSFRNDYMGICQEAAFQDDAGRLMIRPRLIRDLKSFARIWNRNIKEQGFIDVAKRFVANRNAARHAIATSQGMNDE